MNRYFLCLFCCLSSAVLAQTQASSATSASEASALAIVPNPMKLVPGSVVMSGISKWTAGGKQDSGSLTLRVTSSGAVEEDWALSTVSSTFKLGGFGEDRTCQSTDAKGVAKTLANESCFRPVPWFAPWLAYKMSSDGNSTPKEITTTADETASLKRWSFSALPPAVAKAKAKPPLAAPPTSEVQVLYDSQTLLPSRLEFSDYPTSDPARKIDVYVLFSDYRLEQGIMLPHRIQRYVQRTLQVDFQVTNVSTN